MRSLGDALRDLPKLRSLKITLETCRGEDASSLVHSLLEPAAAKRLETLELRFKGCDHRVISETLDRLDRLTGVSILPALIGRLSSLGPVDTSVLNEKKGPTSEAAQRAVERAILRHPELVFLELDLSAMPIGSAGRLLAPGGLLLASFPKLCRFSLSCEAATHCLSADAAFSLGGDLIKAIRSGMPGLTSLRLLPFRDDALIGAIRAMGCTGCTGGAGPIHDMECLRSLELLSASGRSSWAGLRPSLRLAPGVSLGEFMFSNLAGFCPKLTGLTLSPSLDVDLTLLRQLPGIAEVVQRPAWPFLHICTDPEMQRLVLSRVVVKLCRRLELGEAVSAASARTVGVMAPSEVSDHYIGLSSRMQDAVENNASIYWAAYETDRVLANSEAQEDAVRAAAQLAIEAIRSELPIGAQKYETLSFRSLIAIQSGV